MGNTLPPPPPLAAIMADHDRGPEYALVECIGDHFTCDAKERVEGSSRLTDAEIIAILAERGWTVGPTHCPTHAAGPASAPPARREESDG